MREIKFRAWDKERKMWLEINAIDFENKKVYLKGGEIRDFTKVDIMQYTGLKDRHNKEIYEGDIVKNNWFRCDGEFIGGNWVVRYGGHSIDGQDYYSSWGCGFYFDRCDGVENETYNIIQIPFDKNKGIEIIGNVCENPELIKK